MRLALALALPLAVACGPKSGPPGSAVPRGGAAVATLDGATVTQAHVDAIFRQFPPERVGMITPDQKADLLRQLAVEAALYQQAVAEKLHEDPVVAGDMAMAARRVLAEAMLTRVAERAVTDVAVAERYRESLSGQTRPEVKARHILLETEERALELKAELDGGADFVALAKQHSIGPSGPDGGDLDWFHAGMMVGAFSEAAFAADKGELVGPVQTQFGYHLILVEDKRDQVPLAEAAPEIREILTEEALQDEMKAMIERVELAGGE